MKRPRLKILCACRGGNVRSVALKRILSRYLGHDAIAVSLDDNSPETLSFLCDWADSVAVCHFDFRAKIPVQFLPKTRVVHLGEDIWGNSFHPELQAEVVRVLNLCPELYCYGRELRGDKVMADLAKYKQKILFRAPTANSGSVMAVKGCQAGYTAALKELQAKSSALYGQGVKVY